MAAIEQRRKCAVQPNLNLGNIYNINDGDPLALNKSIPLWRFCVSSGVHGGPSIYPIRKINYEILLLLAAILKIKIAACIIWVTWCITIPNGLFDP